MNKGLLRIRGPTYPLKLPCVIKLHVLARSLFYRYAPPFPKNTNNIFESIQISAGKPALLLRQLVWQKNAALNQKVNT